MAYDTSWQTIEQIKIVHIIDPLIITCKLFFLMVVVAWGILGVTLFLLLVLAVIELYSNSNPILS